MLDHANSHDVADQQRPAHPAVAEPGDGPEAAGSLDADPADLADQLHEVPMLDEPEPWL
ncbi:hypothetical protein [Prauserella endophytica]|uniref:hypothetical protein n=1 Tax=Prauserella endophytica TaxID=1592324 RepID=UPI0013052F07|nr:hypothetical protein [Prauserella endophytica]